MRFLLDTHVVIWITGGEQGSARARPEVMDPVSERIVSAASAWEMAIKLRLGKLETARHLVENWAEGLDEMVAAPLAIREEHALRAGLLDWSHNDPFDRLLVAQAQLERLTLVTADRAMLGAPDVDIRPWR